MKSVRQQNKCKIVCGIEFKPNSPDFAIQLWLFHYAPRLQLNPLWRPRGAIDAENPRPYEGSGRFEHFREVATMLWPTDFEFHKYSEEHTRAFCENRETAVVGGGGTSKSTSAAAYALPFFLCAPMFTAILVASTTIEAAERRVWKEILRLYYSAKRRLGGNIFGTTPIQKPKPRIQMLTPEGAPDSAHGIFVIAVAKGEVNKGVNELKGYHEPRMLLIGDETDSIQQAVVDVKANLLIGCTEFQALWLGNDPSLLNPLGQLMQEKKGQPITLAHKEWTSMHGIKCIRSDGYDSPNIPTKKYKGIISQEDINFITKNGLAADSAMAYIMIRGLHPPSGTDETVLSEAALYQFNCFEVVNWQRSFITSAALDSGFGGDNCTLRFFKRGLDVNNKFRIGIDEILTIPIPAGEEARAMAEYEIARKTIELCKARGVAPDEFVIGSTGIGRGTAAVIMREWSPRILRCEEGGAPSTLIVSQEDPRPANELYDRRVTELAMSIREFVEADLIRNLDTETGRQLCNRKKELKNRKQCIETKADFKAHYGESPNEMDALAFYIDLLRTKGVMPVVEGVAKKTVNKDWEKKIRQLDFDASPDAYSDPLLDPAEF